MLRATFCVKDKSKKPKRGCEGELARALVTPLCQRWLIWLARWVSAHLQARVYQYEQLCAPAGTSKHTVKKPKRVCAHIKCPQDYILKAGNMVAFGKKQQGSEREDSLSLQFTLLRF